MSGHPGCRVATAKSGRELCDPSRSGVTSQQRGCEPDFPRERQGLCRHLVCCSLVSVLVLWCLGSHCPYNLKSDLGTDRSCLPGILNLCIWSEAPVGLHLCSPLPAWGGPWLGSGKTKEQRFCSLCTQRHHKGCCVLCDGDTPLTQWHLCDITFHPVFIFLKRM